MTDYIKGNVEYHNKLSPDAWQGNEMIPEVRMHLLKIALFFARSIEIPNFAVKDVVLAGSMANYNYTRFSDFDIHLVTDYKDLKCDDLAAEFYKAKKSIWNELHDITVHKHEAELYVEDIAEPPVSGGVYSILDGTWLREPEYSVPSFNEHSVNVKVKDLIKQIDSALAAANDHNDVNRLISKLKNMRKAGLEDQGEFSVENLAYKVLRNIGYITKLYDAYLATQDQELSLVSENFADGKKPGRKGLAKRTGVDCSQSISKLRSIASHSSGERQRMAHWCANMKSGRKK